MRSATSWEFQIGIVYGAIKFPQFWLYSANRREYFRDNGPIPGGNNRWFFFAWPGYIKLDLTFLERDEDEMSDEEIDDEIFRQKLLLSMLDR